MSSGAFDKDVEALGSYAYTREDLLSAALSNGRITQAVESAAAVQGKTVLDIGCGDGVYTVGFVDRGASRVHGIDPASAAIVRAQQTYANHANLTFACEDIYTMATPATKYDIAVLRGVLHHTPDMPSAIDAACRLARSIVVVEPNGNNPVLKLIEKLSRYHVEHEERSFFPARLRKELDRNAAQLQWSEYVGFVPFFCPPLLARILKVLEPVVEGLPIVRQMACAQYVMRVEVPD